MSSPTRFIVLIIMFAALVGRCNADVFGYSYTTNKGIVIEGSFAGTLEGNLITGLSNATLTIGGNYIEGPLFVTSYSAGAGDYINGGAFASFDGKQNNFGFFDNDEVGGEGWDKGNFLSYTGEQPTVVLGYSLELPFPLFTDNPMNSSWAVTRISSVPEAGATNILFGMVLVSLAAVGRSRRWAEFAKRVGF